MLIRRIGLMVVRMMTGRAVLRSLHVFISTMWFLIRRGRMNGLLKLGLIVLNRRYVELSRYGLVRHLLWLGILISGLRVMLLLIVLRGARRMLITCQGRGSSWKVVDRNSTGLILMDVLIIFLLWLRL